MLIDQLLTKALDKNKTYYVYCRSGNRSTKASTLMSDLGFIKIYNVKDSIVNAQKEAIPKLIELLKDTSFIKLKNTASYRILPPKIIITQPRMRLPQEAAIPRRSSRRVAASVRIPAVPAYAAATVNCGVRIDSAKKKSSQSIPATGALCAEAPSEAEINASTIIQPEAKSRPYIIPPYQGANGANEYSGRSSNPNRMLIVRRNSDGRETSPIPAAYRFIAASSLV